MARTLLLATIIALLSGCNTSQPDTPTSSIPPAAPDCATGHPTAVIASSGCMNGTEFQAISVFTCANGRTLYGIENRWAFTGDDWWTLGGQALWDACQSDT